MHIEIRTIVDLWNPDRSLRLRLSIIGYQFPNEHSDDWLFVRLEVEHQGESYDRIDPALEATELPEIHAWFKALSTRILPKWANLSFTEPCLEFRFLRSKESSVRIAVGLNAELRPPFALHQLGNRDDEWDAVFELGTIEFESILSGIESAMATYPVRSLRCSAV